MKLLLGLTRPTAGEVFLFGMPLPGNEKKILPRVGSLIESPGFYPNLTGTENLKIFATLRGIPRSGAIREALEKILHSREQLTAGLQELCRVFPNRFTLLPSATNFAALHMAEGKELYQYLGEQGIAVRYTGGLVRITCGTSQENQVVLAKIREFLENRGA